MKKSNELTVSERARREVISRVNRGEITNKTASKMLRRSVRQIRRLLRRFQREGDVALVHGLRRRPGNAGKGWLRKRVLQLYRRKYSQLNPAHAVEFLHKHGLEVSRQTLWRWARQEGLTVRRRRVQKHRMRRQRRAHRGELVQMDGSTHQWFGQAEPACVLFVMIDDATNRLHARFYDSEDTAGAFDLFREYARKYGLPLALYVDKDSIYRVNESKLVMEERQRGRKALTQFGRAMRELDVEIVYANSPQAKGRVERANRTLQDRLVKELALGKIRSIQKGNVYLERAFLPKFNRTFCQAAEHPVDVHRKPPVGEELQRRLCVQEVRVVGRDWCVLYEGRVYQIARQHERLSLAGRRVLMVRRPNGMVQALHRNRALTIKEVGSRPKLEKPRKPIRTGKKWKPGPEHPWKNFPLNAVPAPAPGAAAPPPAPTPGQH